MDLQNQMRHTVLVDDEEVAVANEVDVATRHSIKAGGSYVTHDPRVTVGWAPHYEPKAVTERAAELLYTEFDIEAAQIGLRVIDVQSDDVEVL